MKKFQAKRQIKSRLYSRTALVLLVAVMLLFARGVYDIYGRERESARMRAEAESKINDLAIQKANLAGQVDKLQSESGVEEEIRSKFNVAKEGENVVLIVDDEASTTATTTPGFFASFWAKIWK